MALFGKKKEADQAEAKDTTAKKESQVTATGNGSVQTDRDLSAVIIKPHVTEKAVMASERNVYTFEVRQNATKFDVRDAVTQVFGVTPVKVNIVKKSPRKVQSRMRGTKTHEAGVKKAYVYLKKGDSISFV